MIPAKKMLVVFQDKLLDLNIVHTISGVITDVSDISLTVIMQSGKCTVIPKESLLQVDESVINDLAEYKGQK